MEKPLSHGNIFIASLWYLLSISPCIVVNNSHAKQLKPPLVEALHISLIIHTSFTHAQVGKLEREEKCASELVSQSESSGFMVRCSHGVFISTAEMRPSVQDFPN